MLCYVKSVAELHDIELVERVEHPRRKKTPKRFDNSLVYETVGSRDFVSTSDRFKITIYFPVLDTFLNEMSRRFDHKNIELMKAIQACHPCSNNFLALNDLKALIDNYNLDERAITVEATLAKTMTTENNFSNTSEVLLFLMSLP